MARFGRSCESRFRDDISIGTDEPAQMYKGIHDLHVALDELGIKHIYYESPGTGHEWLTWRRSLHQFAPMLFKK